MKLKSLKLEWNLKMTWQKLLELATGAFRAFKVNMSLGRKRMEMPDIELQGWQNDKEK